MIFRPRVTTTLRSRSCGWPGNSLGIFIVNYRNANLEFVAAPALAPPEVTVDLEEQKRIEQEMNAALAQPLPLEDDDDL